ncbi:UNVERIFIED_CONTAM: hypothetical protein K2H54_062708 [Gekko kuhli]
MLYHSFRRPRTGKNSISGAQAPWLGRGPPPAALDRNPSPALPCGPSHPLLKAPLTRPGPRNPGSRRPVTGSASSPVCHAPWRDVTALPANGGPSAILAPGGGGGSRQSDRAERRLRRGGGCGSGAPMVGGPAAASGLARNVAASWEVSGRGGRGVALLPALAESSRHLRRGKGLQQQPGLATGRTWLLLRAGTFILGARDLVDRGLRGSL